MHTQSYLLSRYEIKRSDIQERLKEFETVWLIGDDRHLFKELSFCICTPQSKGRNCWKAIENADRKGVLWSGNEGEIADEIKTLVRFHHTKARRIVNARNRFFVDRVFVLRNGIDPLHIEETRDFLVKHVDGYGYKAATQFLRNIGFGKNFAILDRHIFKNMVRYGVIDKEPSSLTEKKYKELEEKLRRFSQEVNVPIEELDLFWWSEEEGTIFK